MTQPLSDEQLAAIQAARNDPERVVEWIANGHVYASQLLAEVHRLRAQDTTARFATQEQLDRLYAQLSEAADALCAIGKAVIMAEPTLKTPFPDAPHTSPWERFVHQPARRAYNLGWSLRRQLKAEGSP